MDDPPVEHSAPCHQKIALQRKTLDFYFKLLLLLENVMHNQSLVQHCPLTTQVGGILNFTSEAGSPFFFDLPIPAAPAPTQHYQLSLADREGTLPHWMLFQQQSSSLAGLALTEDCGIYHLKLSVIGEHCIAFFYLHILNRTVTDKDSAGDSFSCSGGQMAVWVSLLLQVNPLTLDASQRIRLVSDMAAYLRLPLGFVHLFSRRNPFLHHEKLRVCCQGGQSVSGDVAELLWPVGCRGMEPQSDLAKALEISVKAGGWTKLLEASVLGWDVLCAPGGIRNKIKRDLQRQNLTPSPNVIVPSRIHLTVKGDHSHRNSLSLTELEPSLSAVMTQGGTMLKQTQTEDLVQSIISGNKEALLQFSGTRDDTYLDPPMAFKFTPHLNTLTMLMHHPDRNLEMSMAFSKTNHMKKIQMSSISVFSIKHPVLDLYSEHVSALLEREIILAATHTSVCAEFGCTDSKQISAHNCQKHLKGTGLSAFNLKSLVESPGCRAQTLEATSDASISGSEYFSTTEVKPTVRSFRGDPSADATLSSLSPSSTLHRIHRVTPTSRSATSTLTHGVADRKSLANRLTLRPHPQETPLWTGFYRTSRTDSESQPTLSSLGHVISYQWPIKNHHTAKPTLCTLPSDSHPPLTETNDHVLYQTSSLKTVQSPKPSYEILSAQQFPHVSPTSYLMAEQLSNGQPSGTIQHLSPVLILDVVSQLNVTTQDVSPTTLAAQLPLSGLTELESSLATTFLESSVMTFTPALPSELGFFSGQEPTIENTVFTVESLKASSPATPLSQTMSEFLSPNCSVASSQNNLESPVVADKLSISRTELCFDQNSLMQTLWSGISLMSLQPTWLLPLTSGSLSMFKDQTKFAHESTQLMPSLQQTVHTLLLGEPQQTERFSQMSLVTPSRYLNVTHADPLSVPESTAQVLEDHFDPTAPSTVQETPTTSSIHLDPSFPLCFQSVAQDHLYLSGCTSRIKSTFPTNAAEQVLHFFTSYSQDEMDQTASLSPLLMFDLSGRLFSTQTSNPVMHLSASVTTEINQAAATPQMDISGPCPSVASSGLSVFTCTSLAPKTSALSGNCVTAENSLFISQRDSSGPLTKGRPTRQILCTSLSGFHGMSTTLLTSLQAELRQSSVQPTLSISSSNNLPPKVLQSIPALMATVGFPFRYSVPPKTFLDPEDGEADALSLEIRLIDGPPTSVGTWMALDGLEIHGVPLEVDLQFAPQRLLLAARDSQGLSTWLPLTLDLRRSPVDPCHVFTLTAQRSLHSILRHRHRVELLLRKLSHFFNSSSNHQLSVVSMRPGSTVVSWYNYSLCRTSLNRGRCHVGQIRSMWLAMRSKDGSVNPAFREAMLPEFLITKVGHVSYRQDCFSTTSAPTFDESTPVVHTTLTPGSGTDASPSPTSNPRVSESPGVTATSQQSTYYQRMAGMFTALLVTCILILIVVLVAAVLYFCRGRGRSRASAIWPAGRALSAQSMDRRAIRPRRPPLFLPELPPPPLRLWIINRPQGDEQQLPSTAEHKRKIHKVLQSRPPQNDFSNILY